jgi:hypothetical protein
VVAVTVKPPVTVVTSVVKALTVLTAAVVLTPATVVVPLAVQVPSPEVDGTSVLLMHREHCVTLAHWLHPVCRIQSAHPFWSALNPKYGAFKHCRHTPAAPLGQLTQFGRTSHLPWQVLSAGLNVVELTQNPGSHFPGLVLQNTQFDPQAWQVDVAAIREYPALQNVHFRVTGSQSWQFGSVHFKHNPVVGLTVHPELHLSHFPEPAVVHDLQFGAQAAHPPVPFLTGPSVTVLVHRVQAFNVVQFKQFGLVVHNWQEERLAAVGVAKPALHWIQFVDRMHWMQFAINGHDGVQPPVAFENPNWHWLHLPGPACSQLIQLAEQAAHFFVVASSVYPWTHFPTSQFGGWFVSQLVQLFPHFSHFFVTVLKPYVDVQKPAVHWLGVAATKPQKMQKASHCRQVVPWRRKPVWQAVQVVPGGLHVAQFDVWHGLHVAVAASRKNPLLQASHLAGPATAQVLQSDAQGWQVPSAATVELATEHRVHFGGLVVVQATQPPDIVEHDAHLPVASTPNPLLHRSHLAVLTHVVQKLICGQTPATSLVKKAV